MDTNHPVFTDSDGYDPRIQHPFSMIISGPSNSGKSFFVSSLIRNADRIFSAKIDNFVYVYSCWQPLFDELMKIRPINFLRHAKVLIKKT